MKSLSRFLSLAALAFALAACTTAGPQPPPIAEQLEAVKTYMLTYLSEERARLNAEAKPLRLDPMLAAAAQAHSEAMAEKNAFDDGGADGNVAIQQLAADPDFQGFVGENSAMQYFHPEFGIDPETYARAFVDQWVASPGHRANIEYANFDRAGIGVAAKGDTIYAAGVFATDLGLPPRTD
jgi:uncharacterized protein YkwD